MLKIISAIFLLLVFNGCVQSTGFLGPMLTGVSSGSLSQAGVSFGTNKVINSATGKTLTENIIDVFNNEKKNGDIESTDVMNFNLEKENINKNSSIKNLFNQ
jgi:hypothetical protein